jgi:hypothetical protein
MINPLDVVKVVPAEVVKEVYSDTVKGALQQASSIGVDAMKTIRLALFPLQLASALQDRLAVYIDRAIRMVPPERRIAPVESFALQLSERLRFQEDGSVLTHMYISLLARSMDRERTGDAHPAFLHIVSQLAPDEVQLIEQLNLSDPVPFLVRKGKGPAAILEDERKQIVERSPLAAVLKKRLLSTCLLPEKLAQSDLLFVYIEHLVSLGIVVYTNDPWEAEKWKADVFDKYNCWFIRLNDFGRLLHKACLAS